MRPLKQFRTISVSVFKNAMAVGIPGSDRSGIAFAVDLGITAGDWNRGLELFSSARPVDIEKAARMADEGIVGVNIYNWDEKFYIHTAVETEKSRAEARIRHRHEALEWVDVNGARLWEAASGNGDTGRSSGGDGSPAAAPSKLKIERNAAAASCRSEAELTGLLIGSSAQELLDHADAMPEEELQELTEGVDINIRAAEYGLESSPGMGLGAGVAAIASEQEGQVSLASTVQQYVAAAVDIRMSGAMIPLGAEECRQDHAEYPSAQERSITLPQQFCCSRRLQNAGRSHSVSRAEAAFSKATDAGRWLKLTIIPRPLLMASWTKPLVSLA
jgi:L-cysteine desulfidase